MFVWNPYWQGLARVCAQFSLMRPVRHALNPLRVFLLVRARLSIKEMFAQEMFARFRLFQGCNSGTEF
jgi:hypothetical protein